VTARSSVLVVGAGISGLACAYALHKAGIQVQLAEAAELPGGLIRSERQGAFLLEYGPQNFLATPTLRELCRELELEKEVMEAPRKALRFILLDGKLREAPLSPGAFLSSFLFSTGTKWRAFRDVLGRSQPPDDDESIAGFVRRKFSEELLEKLVDPFVSGVFARDQ